MRFYTQLVVWTYVVLPAICILLSPTLLLGVAKAQQQRAKLMANALAAKSKMAAAVARNNAKLYQHRVAPNHNVHNVHNFFPSAYPQQHKFRSIRDVSGSPSNWDVSKQSHWDQQDESMGVLQNMWNMNSFGNTQNGGVVRLTRNENQQLNDVPLEETIVGSPRIYEDKQRQTIERNANTGPLFRGRNVYDAVVGQGNPLNNEIENIKEGAFNNNFEFGNEGFDETDFTGFSEDEEEFARHKKNRKNKNDHSNHYYPQYNYYQGDKYKGHDYDIYKRNDADGGVIPEDMISTDPNLKSYLPAEEQTEERSKNRRKGHHHHSYDYTYYGRNNKNEELLPEEIIAGDPNLMSPLLADAQAEEISSKNKGKGHHHGHVHYDRSSANESPVQYLNMPPTGVQTSNFDQNQQVDQTPIISEDGAILGTFLNLPDQGMPTLDYQKAVEEVQEFNKKLVEATQRLAHPVVTPPSDIFHFAPEVPTFPEPFPPSLMNEKSASPDPDPHHHHLRGFSHTHTHTHSHELRPLSPPPYPNGGFGHNEFGQHGFGQASANANAFANSGFSGQHGGFVPSSGGFSQADALSKSGFGGGFGQAQANAQAQALSKSGFGGGFGNSQANAQAVSQSASSGFGGAASQAIAQANAASHAGPQFFQVLGPSNFVNARSKEGATIPQPLNNEFMMPHLEEIPVNDMMHEMETGRMTRLERSSVDGLKLETSNKNNDQKLEVQVENKTPLSTTFQNIPSIAETLSQNAKIQDNQRISETRSKRSAKPQDSKSDIFSGLSLASEIVHSALDLSSKIPTSRKVVEHPTENNANIMKSVGGIVNSGLAAAKSNNDDQEFETNQDGEALTQVTPLTAIVNMDLNNNKAHKRVHRSLTDLDNQDVFQGLNLASGIVQSSVGLGSELQQSPRQDSDSVEDNDGEDLTKELIALHSHRNASTKAHPSEADILELNPELNEDDDEATIIEMATDILKTHEASKQMKRFPRGPEMTKVTQTTEKPLETQTDAPCQIMSNTHSAEVNGRNKTQRLNSNIVGATIVSKPDSKEVVIQKTSKSVKKTIPNYDDEMIEMINPDSNQKEEHASATENPSFNDSKSSVVLDLHKHLDKTDATKHNILKESGQVVSMMNPDDMHQENTPNLPESSLKEDDITKPFTEDTFDLHKRIEGIDTTKHMPEEGTSVDGLPHLKDTKQMAEGEKSSHERVQMINPDDFPQVNQPSFTEPPSQADHVTELFAQGSLDLHKQFEEADSNKHQIGQTSFVGMPLLKNMNQMMRQDQSEHEIIQMINPDDFPQQNQPTFTEPPLQVDHVTESFAQGSLDLHKQFEEADSNKHQIGQTSFVGMPLLKNMNQMMRKDQSNHEITQMINPDDFPQQNQPTFTEPSSQVDHVSESLAQENLDLHKQFEEADSNQHNLGQTSFVGMPHALGSINQMTDMPRGSSHEIISMTNPDDIEREQNLKNIEGLSKEDEDIGSSNQENPNAQFEKTDSANLNSNDDSILGMPPLSGDNQSEESKELPPKSDKSSKESSEEQYHPVTTTIINTSTIVPSVSVQNVTTFTPDEIEEIQFGIPDEEVINESTTFSKVEDHTSKVAVPSEANTEASLAVTTTGISGPSTELPISKADDIIKVSKEEAQNSTNPFASVEEEMKTLTEEQKQEFLKQEEQLIADILAAAGVNYDGILKPNNSQSDQTVASPNLLDILEDRRSNWMNEHSSYYRNARSPMKDGLDSILGAQREHLSNIQKDATGDDDLLMISFIGDSIIKDLENRRDKVDNLKQRPKREIVGLGTVSKLMANPNTKIDVPKTFDNVGAVVRQTFESPKAPMYHVRNMLGNTKNTIMSAAKIPPNNIILPSQYQVSKIEGQDEQVGAINQKMLISRSGGETVAPTLSDTPTTDGDSLGIMDTFHKIGGMVKESMDSGKNVVYHANDAASDARNAFYTAGTTVPRLIIPPNQLIATRSALPGITKPVIISPRIVEMKEDALGSQQQHPAQFVGMGQILDAVGITKPEHSNVELQQIVLSPSSLRHHLLKQANPFTLDDPVLEQTETLVQAEKSTGAKNLKEFFNKMHQEMKEILTSQHEDRKRIRNEKLQFSKARLQKRKDYTLGKQKSGFKRLIPDYDEITDQNTEHLPKKFVLYRQSDIQMSNSNDETTLQQENGGLTLRLQNRNHQEFDEMNYPTTILPPEVLKVFTDDLPKDFVLHRQADTQMRHANDKKILQQSGGEALELQNQNQQNLDEINSPTTILPPEVLKAFTDDLPKDFVLHRQADTQMRNANGKISLKQQNGGETLGLQNQNQQNFDEINHSTTILPPVLETFSEDLPKDFVLHRQPDTQMRNANDKMFLKQPNDGQTLELQNQNHQNFDEMNYPTTILPPEVLKAFTDDLPKDFVLHRQADSQNIGSKNAENQNGDQTLGLYLVPELMKPFMGQPNEATFENFLKENGDEVPSMRQNEDHKPKKTLVYPITPLNLNITIPRSEKPLNLSEWLPHPAVASRNPDTELRPASRKELPMLVRKNHPLGGIEDEQLGQLLGAKNPEMFEQIFNESLRKQEEHKERKTLTDELLSKSEPDTDGETKKPTQINDHTTEQVQEAESPEDASKKPGERTSMVMPESYKKPFMGHSNPKKISELLNQYNGSNSKSDENFPYVDPIKNVVYSSEENYYGVM